jgi:hypothetical protein
MNNINGVIARMQVVSEQQLHSSLALPRVEPSKEQLRIWENFTAHCQRRGLPRNFPASPAIAADFLQTLTDTDLEPACYAIVAIHDSVGASNPVATLAVRTVLERRLRPETPRSWSREDKTLFASLPVEIRAILTRRENERDASLRTRQNKLAAEMKRLTSSQQDRSGAKPEAEPKKEVDNEQR